MYFVIVYTNNALKTYTHTDKHTSTYVDANGRIYFFIRIIIL